MLLCLHNIEVMLILLAGGVLRSVNHFLLFTSLQLLLNQDACVLVGIKSLGITPGFSVSP